MGKALARGSRKKIALECLSDAVTRTHVLKGIGREVRQEMKVMCSEATSSILKSNKKEDLSSFSWSKLSEELSTNAPLFLSILEECTKTRLARPNRQAVVGVCAAVLLKHRFNQMSLLQKILSLILFNGCASKAVSILQDCVCTLIV